MTNDIDEMMILGFLYSAVVGCEKVTKCGSGYRSVDQRDKLYVAPPLPWIAKQGSMINESMIL